MLANILISISVILLSIAIFLVNRRIDWLAASFLDLCKVVSLHQQTLNKIKEEFQDE